VERGITWYDILGVLPGASRDEIQQAYDDKAALLRPELVSGAPSNVVAAVSRSQRFLDEALRFRIEIGCAAHQLRTQTVGTHRRHLPASLPDTVALALGDGIRPHPGYQRNDHRRQATEIDCRFPHGYLNSHFVS